MLEVLVLFSCKITHSIMTALDRRGEDLASLYEKCDWPSEFLRDPSSWLEADKMEQLLKLLLSEYDRDLSPAQRFENEAGIDLTSEPLLISVGHHSKDLRSWGVLDSVLRMVQTPKDLFAQPERFLSYFISPAPPIGQPKRGADFVSFVLPVSEMQFPLVTSYLRAALEALPSYINKPLASVTWENSRVTISWSDSELSLFSEAQSAEVSLHPELMRNILMNLETSQKELEETKRQLAASEEECERLKNLAPVNSSGSKQNHDLSDLIAQLSGDGSVSLDVALSELYRLGDYVARGHQLITLLVGQGRQTPQVQEAMRRVDWALVVEQGPLVIKRAVHSLQALQATVSQLPKAQLARESGSRQDHIQDGGPLAAPSNGATSAIQTTLFSQRTL
jgi:hypothetical protein